MQRTAVVRREESRTTNNTRIARDQSHEHGEYMLEALDSIAPGLRIGSAARSAKFDKEQR
jgi:hypothetical protein